VRKLFKNTQTPYLVNKPTNFPSGLAVKTESGVYWIKDGKRYKLISDRAANSWAFTTSQGTENAISHIKVVGKLGFRDGSLIKNISDGKIYLISQNKRRHIISPDVFERYGLNRSAIIEVSEVEVNMHNIGEDLNAI
jgi:hypothetical protein